MQMILDIGLGRKLYETVCLKSQVYEKSDSFVMMINKVLILRKIGFAEL